jgi:hypothetical protein
MHTPLNANITICKVEGYWNVIFDYVSVEFRSTHPLAFVLTAFGYRTTNHLPHLHQPPHMGG